MNRIVAKVLLNSIEPQVIIIIMAVNCNDTKTSAFMILLIS